MPRGAGLAANFLALGATEWGIRKPCSEKARWFPGKSLWCGFLAALGSCRHPDIQRVGALYSFWSLSAWWVWPRTRVGIGPPRKQVPGPCCFLGTGSGACSQSGPLGARGKLWEMRNERLAPESRFIMERYQFPYLCYAKLITPTPTPLPICAVNPELGLLYLSTLSYHVNPAHSGEGR